MEPAFTVDVFKRQACTQTCQCLTKNGYPFMSFSRHKLYTGFGLTVKAPSQFSTKWSAKEINTSLRVTISHLIPSFMDGEVCYPWAIHVNISPEITFIWISLRHDYYSLVMSKPWLRQCLSIIHYSFVKPLGTNHRAGRSWLRWISIISWEVDNPMPAVML